MKTCAIIVTYNPNIDEFYKYYQTNRQEVDYVIIVDNSEDLSIRKTLLSLNIDTNTEIIQLKENYGIAYAQNVGIKKAQELQKLQYLLFLDQDSLLLKGTLDQYKQSYKFLMKNYKVAALGIGNNQQSKEKFIEVNQIISSGTFSPIKVFDDIGYFDESLFIDFVEYDWCWRAKAKGYSIFSINDISLIHMRGNGVINILGFSMVLPSNIRLYYQYRNFLFLLHKAYVPLTWKIKMFIKMFIKIPLYFIYLPKRRKTFQYILKGIRDYFFNKKGKID